MLVGDLLVRAGSVELVDVDALHDVLAVAGETLALEIVRGTDAVSVTVVFERAAYVSGAMPRSASTSSIGLPATGEAAGDHRLTAAHRDRVAQHIDLAAVGVGDAPGHRQVLNLRVGERLGDVVDRAARDADGVESGDPLGARGRGESALQLGVELAPVVVTVRGAGEAIVGRQVRLAEHLAQPSPQPAGGGRDVEEPVGGAVRAHRAAGGMVVALLRWHLAVDRPAHRLEVEEREHRFEQRHLHPLPQSAAVALAQCEEDADRQLVAGGHVRHGDAGAHRPLTRLAGDAHHPGDTLDDLVDGTLVARRSGLAVAGDAPVDQAGVDRRQRGVVDAERGLHRGTVVLHDDVGVLDEAQEPVPVGVVAQVQPDQGLGAVEVDVVRAVVVTDDRSAPTDLLDAQHGGAPVGEVAHGRRAGAGDRQVEDEQVVEHRAHGHTPRNSGSRLARKADWPSR